jgi:hypothetical protein
VVAERASDLAFQPAAEELARDRGIHISAKEVDRTVREVATWRRDEETALTASLFGDAATAQRLAHPDDDPLSSAPTLHAFDGWEEEDVAVLSVDGAMLRSPNNGPNGLEWFECRAAIIADLRADARCRKIYLGGILSPDEVFDLLRATWCKGGNTKRRCVFVADGGKWIWERVRFYFPEAIQVLDIYHAAEHVGSAAAACWGEGSDLAQSWRGRAREMLLEQSVSFVLRALLKALRDGEAMDREALLKEIRYLYGHRHRMSYSRIKQQGLPVGSGIMESSIKQLSTHRLRQAGMKWTKPGADAMLRVRAASKSGSLIGTIHRRRTSLTTTTHSRYATILERAA